MTGHPDDEFHPPTSDDPFWTETCWFTFTVPERGLSGQVYPFFRPNQGVAAAAVYLWEGHGNHAWDCRYGKNLWHLPLPDRPLSDMELANGLRLRSVDPGQRYEIGYVDPDTGACELALTFTGLTEPHRLGDSHLDQPGRVRGRIHLDGEEIAVDAFGFRDRSWGPRSQIGAGLASSDIRHGGYSYATASADDAFHTITMDLGDGCVSIHGYLVRDGRWAALASGRRDVLERDPATGFPRVVQVEGVDELGRQLHAEGTCVNQLGFAINPNLFTVNCLTAWDMGATTAHGEDHDNWSAVGIREFLRRR